MSFNGETVSRHPVKAGVIFLFFLNLFLLGTGRGEVVDRIAAVVNDEVITLTDINIIETFGLFDDLKKTEEENIQKLILERLISQKLVIQLASERVMIDEKELETSLSVIIQKTAPDLAEKALLQFGLDWDDLKSYLREKILFQKIVSQRFNRGVTVSIEEIEKYYEHIYVPSQREKNLNPQPMIELLDQIEVSLRKEKVEGQIKEWIKSLKREANIQIKISSFTG